MKTITKRLNELLLYRIPLLPRLIAGLLRLLHRSCHFTILGGEHEEVMFRHDGPRLATFWHFAFPTIIYRYRDRGIVIMVSRSRDGEWAARVCEHLGFLSFRGSPGKGGSTALLQLISHVGSKFGGGFIADGSQGPAQVAQKGILLLARYADAPLIPVTVAAKPCWRLRTWDRTLIPMPFSHIVVAFGAPIRVSRKVSAEELERIREQLEDSLNTLTAQAESALAVK